MVFIAELLEGPSGTIWDVVRSVAIVIAVIIALLSFYFSKLQGAKIKAVEVHDQTPLGPAAHTIIFTNYGNKTGVAIGPTLVSDDKSMRIAEVTDIPPVHAIEPRGTKIIEFEVHSDSAENPSYHIEFKDIKGKAIKLPTRTFLGKVE